MSREAVLDLLRSAPVIAPSMLKCDFGNLQREISLLDAAGARLLHWDVMDGHFVPNLSYGAMVIEKARPLTRTIFEAHLMMSDPGKYLDGFIKAGCQVLTIHIEAVPEPSPLLRKMRAAGIVAGLSLNPGTPVERLTPWLSEADLVLVMSVEPGFGGQKFIPTSLDKLKRLRALMPADAILSVDGGIDHTTISEASAAGSQVFVAGSSVFETPDYTIAMKDLASRAVKARAAKPKG